MRCANRLGCASRRRRRPGAAQHACCVPAPRALVVGIAAAALLVAYAVWVGPHVGPRRDLAAFAAFDMPLVTKTFCGGLGEEIVTRWARVSLFAAIGLVITRAAQATTPVMATAVTAADDEGGPMLNLSNDY